MLQVRTYVGPSKLHGLGLFAAEDIEKDAIIWRFTPGVDSVLTQEQVDALSPVERDAVLHFAYKWEGQYFYCADGAKYMNHAGADANTGNGELDADQWGGPTIATRAIAAGEELTCDYGDFDELHTSGERWKG
jgi:hypothetical protein